MEDDLLSDGSEILEQAQKLNLHQLRSSTNQKTQLREWSMVVIRDDQRHNDCSIFPPINHENLHNFLQSHQHDKISTSSSSSSDSSSSSSCSVSSFSPSYTDTWGPSSSLSSDSLVQKTGGFTGWMSIGLEIFRSKLFAMVTTFRNYAANKGAIWSIGPAAAAVLLSWWMYTRVWCRLKQRRRTHIRRENHLMTIIKEKDERIARLLHQIAQMNELLIARHKALMAKLAE